MAEILKFKFPKKTIDEIGLCKYGVSHFLLSLPFEISGRGIEDFSVKGSSKQGNMYVVTETAFRKLVKQYLMVRQAYEEFYKEECQNANIAYDDTMLEVMLDNI